jgi:hypothetical protein
MRRSRFSAVSGVIVCAIIFSSCVKTWTRVENPQMKGPNGLYRVTVPACWIHAAFIADRICISKDGPSLNWIEVSHFDRSAGFPLTHTTLNGDHLITEVAEYDLAELKARFKGHTVNHLATEPAEIDGKTGFRMRLELIMPSGLVFDVMAYGMMDEGHFYQMLYKAPRIHYYEKELATFEDFVATFKTAL